MQNELVLAFQNEGETFQPPASSEFGEMIENANIIFVYFLIWFQHDKSYVARDSFMYVVVSLPATAELL